MKLKLVVIADIVDNVRRIFQALAERSKKIEHETNLTGPQLWVVKLLKETSPMKVSELARRMRLHPATMVGLLDRLEAKGMLKRTRSEKDRRVVYIDLTEQGNELKINSPEVVQNLLEKGLEGFAGDELKTISESLGHVAQILGVQVVSSELIMPAEIKAPRKNKTSNTFLVLSAFLSAITQIDSFIYADLSSCCMYL